MYRLRMESLLLLAAALLAACTDRDTPSAPSTRPLASAAGAVGGSLVELSRPNAVGTCDDGFASGAWSIDEAEEPVVAVNPVRPSNIVAAWIQGPFQNIVAAASFDGGQTWQRVPVPLTTCAGGQFLIAGDVWLSFAPDGILYGIALAGNALSAVLPEVLKSTDGGLQWTASVPPGSSNIDPPADHPSITADPTNASFVYAIWDGSKSPHSGAAVFSRTTNGGSTWETPRAIVEAPSQSFIQFSQILVLPNGTLIDLYEFYAQQPNGPITQTSLQLMRSADHGQSWSTPVDAIAMTPLYRPDGETLVIDRETGQFIQDPTNPSFSVAMQNGNLKPARRLIQHAGPVRLASRIAHLILKASPRTSKALPRTSQVHSFWETTSGWPALRMISWPRLHSLTETTSRASSSLGASFQTAAARFHDR